VITVVRFGHRKGRDTRITTHVGLTARAFGADRFVLAGSDDRTPLRTLEKVTEKWGGPFETVGVDKWRPFLRKRKGKLVHLTMYGLPLPRVLPQIRKDWETGGELMVFVGAEKVPPDVYEMADYNVAVGSQPHSEVAALAVFLDRLTEGRLLEDSSRFKGAELRLTPCARGKLKAPREPV